MTKRKNQYLCIDIEHTLDLTKGKTYTSIGKTKPYDNLILDTIRDDKNHQIVNTYKGMHKKTLKLIEPKEPIKRINPILNGLMSINRHGQAYDKKRYLRLSRVRLRETLWPTFRKSHRKCEQLCKQYNHNVNMIINLINDGVIKI